MYSGEYVVATKNLSPAFSVSSGLGWGRLGSRDPIFDIGTRTSDDVDRGGKLTYQRWFRGSVAAFGGIKYTPNENLGIKLEYSSDLYVRETKTGSESAPSSPVNVGLDYTFNKGNTQLSLYHVLGDEVGAQISFLTNPKTSGVPGGLEPAGLPVAPRAAGSAADLGWTQDSTRQAAARSTLAGLIAKEGMTLEGMTLDSRRATVRVVNPKYQAEAQAIGRVARAMTRSLPASVEEFEIIPVVEGMPLASVVVTRTDLERYEHEAAASLQPRVRFSDAYGRAPQVDAGIYPQLDWSLGPALSFSFFDPDEPVRVDVGLRLAATYQITPGLELSGSVVQRLEGNRDEVETLRESALPRVRTDQYAYSAEGDQTIEYLQLAHYGRLGRNVYSRVTAGYLEDMYGGVSTEVLWKPVDSRLALGAELNYVQRRDFDQLFGFQDMTTTDPVTGIERDIPEFNGHLSAYYAFGNGFHGQIDAGRYLAGDYGATISLDREFANGWSIGAYATFTDVSYEDYGEGSFDKGIRFTIPIASLIGQPTRQENNLTIQSLKRDGGARLNVRGRLYDQVRDYHEPNVVDTWGSFWR